MRKNLLPFSPPLIGQEEIKEVVKTIKSGWLTSGPKVEKLEKNFAKFVNAKYAIATNSCTAALHLCLKILNIKNNDEVIVPTMTFAATAEIVEHVNARSILVDVNPDTLIIDPKQIEKAITKKTKAIIPVHHSGQAGEIDKILKIAKKHKLKVVWDAAHALPTKYKNKMIGSFPDLTCFSFYVNKTLAAGQGGMITTNNKKWAEQAHLLRFHGINKNPWKRTSKGSWHYEILAPGFEYNLTDIAASLGLVQLKRVNSFLQKRKKFAQEYNKAFKGLQEIDIPVIEKNTKPCWHLYVVKLNLGKLKINRDNFVQELKKRNISFSVHFIPLHLHPYYRKKYGYKANDFPQAYTAYKRIISLPIYPKMTQKDIEDVIWAVKDIVKKFKK